MCWSCFAKSNIVFLLDLRNLVHRYRTSIRSVRIIVGLKVLFEELDACFERALLSSRFRGLGQVCADSEAVHALGEVLSPVQSRGLQASTEDVIRLLLSLWRELRVCFTAVDQERNFCLPDSLS